MFAIKTETGDTLDTATTWLEAARIQTALQKVWATLLTIDVSHA